MFSVKTAKRTNLLFLKVGTSVKVQSPLAGGFGKNIKTNNNLTFLFLKFYKNIVNITV